MQGRKGSHRQRSSPVVKSVVPIEEGDVLADEAIDSSQPVAQNEEDETSKEAEEGEPSRQDWSVEKEEDFAVVFAEYATKEADPVGMALSYHYTDDPTIPPAYDAKCIKSTFFHEGKADEFASSVRERTDWPTSAEDPALKSYPGMVERRFSGSDGQSYSCFKVPVPHPENASIKLPPRFRIHRELNTQQLQPRVSSSAETASRHDPSNEEGVHRHSQVDDRNRDYQATEQRPDWQAQTLPRIGQRAMKRGLEGGRHGNDRDWKRNRMSSSNGDASPPRTDRGLSTRPSPLAQRKSHDGDITLSRAEEDHNRLPVHHAPPERQNRSQERELANPRHDSGYHSGQSRGRRQSPRRGQYDGTHQQNRSYSRGRTQSRSPNGRDSRGSSSTTRGRSRSNSPLTALEAELLGISQPTESRKGSLLTKPVRRRVKVSAAYRYVLSRRSRGIATNRPGSRRW
jgi:hypothetical protein